MLARYDGEEVWDGSLGGVPTHSRWRPERTLGLGTRAGVRTHTGVSRSSH